MTLTIKFKLSTKLTKNSIIKIKLDKLYVKNKSSSHVCNKIESLVKSVITCTQSQDDSTHFTIQFTEFCNQGKTECPAGSVMEIEITKDIQNQLWVQDNLSDNAIMIESYTTDGIYLVDKGQSQLAPVVNPLFYTKT